MRGDGNPSRVSVPAKRENRTSNDCTVIEVLARNTGFSDMDQQTMSPPLSSPRFNFSRSRFSYPALLLASSAVFAMVLLETFLLAAAVVARLGAAITGNRIWEEDGRYSQEAVEGGAPANEVGDDDILLLAKRGRGFQTRCQKKGRRDSPA